MSKGKKPTRKRRTKSARFPLHEHDILRFPRGGKLKIVRGRWGELTAIVFGDVKRKGDGSQLGK